jgi:Cu2+-exporting ATPase
LQIAAALQRGSAHPLARLFQPYDDGRPATQLQQHALGVSGWIDGQHYRMGRADFADGSPSREGEVLLAQVDGPNRVVFGWDEQLKPGAHELLASLRALGITVHLLSGDAVARVQRIASQLGIDDWMGAATPQSKLARLGQLRVAADAPAQCIAMVGDGDNDAPSLAGADVSFALSEGADAARQAADIVLCSPRLQRISEALQLARKLRRVCQQSLLWALLYNLGMLPLAVTGLLSPGWAALGMSLSSLLVTLNALRLRRPLPAVQVRVTSPEARARAVLAVSQDFQ